MEAVKDVPVVTQTELFSVSSSFEFILNNQIYIYAVLILIVLIIIGWYLYNKYFNKKKEGDDNDDEEEEEKEEKKESETKSSKKNNKVKIESKSEESKNIIDPKKKYYLVVPKGNPLLLNPYFNDIVSHKLEQDEVPQRPQPPSVQQMQQAQQAHQVQQMKQAQQAALSKQKNRPKLSHPGDQENISLNDLEDENLAALNLTNDEMVELKKQLLQLQKTQKQQVTAQNDEDSDE